LGLEERVFFLVEVVDFEEVVSNEEVASKEDVVSNELPIVSSTDMKSLEEQSDCDVI
jgi:hypothetical protein